MFSIILRELRNHAPFTLLGALTGLAIMVFSQKVSGEVSHTVFYTLHPIHVVLSALVTASMYEIHKCGLMKRKCNIWVLLAIGYIGSVGIATLSDSVISYWAMYLTPVTTICCGQPSRPPEKSLTGSGSVTTACCANR